MTEEKEPMYVRYVSLTPKGRRLLEALDKMLADLGEDIQSSEGTVNE